jgi:hypothetical protein
MLAPVRTPVPVLPAVHAAATCSAYCTRLHTPATTTCDTAGVSFKSSSGLSLIQGSQRMIMSFSLTFCKVVTMVESNFFNET